MRHSFLLSFFLLLGGFLQAQQTPAQTRVQGLSKRQSLENNSLVTQIPFRNIGPSIMSGRVTDIAVRPDKPEEFYVAYASGGLWYTSNNGQSFTPLFDEEDVMTIGAISVDWKTGVIYIGTGEVNSSRSSYAGLGVYRSDDKGKTWEWRGLPESHHIGSIILDPDNSEVVYVAVLGHLYTTNPERGVYKSVDGGKNWQQTLYVNERTGAVEVSMDPNNKNILYACMWERERSAWNFSESGNGSGIYKSSNAGSTWEKISGGLSGFPDGKGVGRTGLSIFPGSSNILFAVVDNQFPDSSAVSASDTNKLSLEDFNQINKEKFLALDDEKLASFLTEQGIPEEFTVDILKKKVRTGEFRPSVLNEYLSLGAYVFDLPIIGCEVYKSENGGSTWIKVNKSDLGSMYYTYGYYFGKIFISPTNENKVAILGVPVALSNDGGVTFQDIGGDNVHADHHMLWINPQNDQHMILGNDGGINITYDSGQNWIKANNPAVGQFYALAVDDAKPYNVYGGLQDNGVWFGPSNYNASNSWTQEGKYPYTFLFGGDGMQVQVDTRDNKTVYTGYQFGFYARLNTKDEEKYLDIRPRQAMGEYPLRFNWQTPILLSSHNQDVLYYGSNRMHRSLHKGEELETMSADLSNGGKQGDVPYGTISSMAESPLQFGLLYAGTDDGNMHISDNGGYTWNNISAGLPKGLWVSRVVASAHNVDRVYASLNGYRQDDFRPYIYVSNDRGAHWKPLATDLPYEPVNVIREDPLNPSLLYIGTDNGLYISLNQGVSCMAMRGSGDHALPRVAVHDLVIQEREQELVVGTHGRSIFIADISKLQLLTDSLLIQGLHIFQPEKLRFSDRQGNVSAWNSLGDPYIQTCNFVLYAGQNGTGVWKISNQEGMVLHLDSLDLEKGLNYLNYDLSVNKEVVKEWDSWVEAGNGHWYLTPGIYFLEVETKNGLKQSVEFEVFTK